ncbi:MAG: hypothetical protein K5866_03015 [Treponema sp.]|nr:hypothetical protein [Treponema sp.]
MKKNIQYSILIITLLNLFLGCSYTLNEKLGTHPNKSSTYSGPSSFKGNYYSNQANLSWEESKKASYYEIWVNSSSPNINEASLLGETENTYYYDKDFNIDTYKFYWVRAFNSRSKKYSDYSYWILVKGTTSTSTLGDEPTEGLRNYLNPSSSYYSTKTITYGDPIYWYYNLEQGKTYNVHWVDCNDGTSLNTLGYPTGDIYVSCYLSNSSGMNEFTDVDDGYTTEQSFVAGYTGYYVMEINANESGTFGLGIYEVE